MVPIGAKVRVAILGASGYTGAELVRLLRPHPGVEIALLTAERRAGQTLGDVFPHLYGNDLPRLAALREIDWGAIEIDAAFCALPHGTGQDVVARFLQVPPEPDRRETDDGSLGSIDEVPKGVRIFDLSADFRLRDPGVYRDWYGAPHRVPGLLGRSVYGLTEFAREEVAGAGLVACPGCYPTAALLPLVPLLEAGLILPSDIVIDAKSGVSGAGRAEKEANLFAEVSEAIHPYGLAGHRHAPEIEQMLSLAAGDPVTVSFTPHLVPMNRGILATMYVRLAEGAGAADARRALLQRFRDEPFVRVLEAGRAPATRMVRGANSCAVNLFEDRAPGRVIVVSAIDNLVKGAAGQAVQNFNVAYEFPETLGLEAEPLFP